MHANSLSLTLHHPFILTFTTSQKTQYFSMYGRRLWFGAVLLISLCHYPFALNRDGLHNFVQIILSRPDMLQLPEVVEFLGLDKQPDPEPETEQEEDDGMDVDSVNRSGKPQFSTY